MSLLGPVRHLTEDERYWFQMRLAGLPVKRQLWTAEHPRGGHTFTDAQQKRQQERHGRYTGTDSYRLAQSQRAR